MILHIAHKFTLPLLQLLLLLLILLLPFTTTTNTAATTTNNENDIMVYRADEKLYSNSVTQVTVSHHVHRK